MSEAARVTYVIVPVRFAPGEEPEIDISDEGEPGLWGDTWVAAYDHPEGGFWTFDGELNAEAYGVVEAALKSVVA